MRAHEILFGARQYLRGLGVEVADDDQVWPELSQEEERIIDALVGVGNASYPLPGDLWMGGAIAAVATPWMLAADMWRFRRAMLSYSDGTPQKLVRLVDEVQGRVTPPQVQPSAFIFRSGLVGVGADAAAAADRRWGWKNGSRVCLLYVSKPVAITGPESVSNAPDDAKKYLARYIGRFMARRLPELPVEKGGAMDADVGRARKELLESAERYGRTGYGA